MIDEHRVLNLEGEDGIIEVEINWNETVSGCRMLKLSFNGEEVIVDRDRLVSLLMLIGTESDQKKMMPMKLTRIRKMERMLTFSFNASKDYRKGEPITIKAPWIDEVPDVEEVFAGNVKARKKNPLSVLIKGKTPEA